MKPKLFIGLPVYHALDPQFAQCLINLHLDPPTDEFLVGPNIGDSLVSRSRNTITANFLDTDATHLLWLDSDLIFSPAHVKRLLAHSVELVGGFYPKKSQGPLEWVCNALDGEFRPPRPDGLQEIKFAGTGFLLIARTVFEQMIAGFGSQIGYRADTTGRQEYDFWTVGVHEYPDGARRYLSEDWFFCQRWRDLGGTVWGDTRVICKHIGHAIYPLQTQMAELTAPVPGFGSDTAIRPAPSPADRLVSEALASL